LKLPTISEIAELKCDFLGTIIQEVVPTLEEKNIFEKIDITSSKFDIQREIILIDFFNNEQQ
jgi:hypothetical protein